MRAAHQLRCFLAISALLGYLAALPIAAAERQKLNPESSVERALRAEVAGSVDRRGALQDLPDSAPARWQAGFVRDGETWRSFDASVSEAGSDTHKQYVARRAEAQQTAAAQLDLANWCRKHELPDQERAHLNAVLSIDPQGEHSDVLKRLGYRPVAGVWLAPEQLADWRNENRRVESSLKKWGARVERIAGQFAGSAREQAQGRQALGKLAEPDALPAIEYTLCGRDEPSALAAVEVISRMSHPEATTALARQGVFSEWPAVRKSAAAALKTRRFEDFVPPLISLLALPPQEEYRIATNPAGTVLLQSYILAVEMNDQFHVQVFNVVKQVVDQVAVTVRRGTPWLPPERVVLATPLQSADEMRSLAVRLSAQHRERVAVEGRVQALNERVTHVLTDVSGVDGVTDPRQWWQWWNNYTDMQAASKKSVVVVSEETANVPIYVAVVTGVSCFAGGTPVWTETGAMPIENIQVGDRVLAKDIETGELTYKPVLQTTVRPPKELITLRLSNESILCTGGHRFWQSGSGWVKARDLGSATLVHTATGNTPVWSAKKGDAAETYNLVVADFHTYFVGQTGILCQDLLMPRPTNKVVPGLDRTQIASGGN